MDQVTGSWYPDPTGRYAQRWWDGERWTDSVADAAGTVATDPLAPAPTPAGDGTVLIAPLGSAVVAAPSGPAVFSAAPGPAVFGGPQLVDHKGRWLLGVLVSIAGAAALAVNFLVLDWFRDIGGRERGFADARDLFDSASGGSGASYSELYMSFGWIVGAAVVGLAVVVAAVRMLPMVRLVAAPCGIGLLMHAATVVDLRGFDAPGDFEVLPGAWLGVAGYGAALVGAVVAASSRP